MSPTFAGTYSPEFDRVTLEAGQDLAKNGNPVQSSQNFVGELTTPQFPWTAFTIVLVLLRYAGGRRRDPHAAGTRQTPVAAETRRRHR